MATEAGYETTDEALDVIEEYFEDKALTKDDPDQSIGFNAVVKKKVPMAERTGNFANARLVRNFLETAVMNQADRLYAKQPLSDEELKVLEYEDVKGIA